MSIGIVRYLQRRHLPLTLLASLALAPVIAGCRDEPRLDGPTAAMLTDPSKRHPIGYSGRTEALYVEVATDGLGLSGNQASDVYRFLDRYKSEGQGPLKIAAPASVRGHFSVSKSMRDVEELVDRSGVPLEAVQRQRTGGKVDKFGPAVKLSYDRALAVPPHCGNWPEDLGRVDREKLPSENFGCASQRNFALTVANARDLQVPQEETPRSSERRSATWSKYTGAAPAPAAAPASGTTGGGNPKVQ